ncbi:MAG: peptidoglycan DD-metalloendopeptidase family protein [Nitrospinota bacterium]
MRWKITIWVLLIALFSYGCADVGAIRKYRYRDYLANPETKHHRLQKNETIYSLARKYNTSVKSILKHNRSLNPNSIPVGAKIVIPPADYFLANRGDNQVAVSKKSSNEAEFISYSSSNKKVPFKWPLEKVNITSRFGIRNNKKHDGIDMSAPEGSAVLAAANGTVIFEGEGPSGYGNVVILKHNRKYITVYAHNSANYVQKGVKVKGGEKIAAVGQTGRATGPHLHFEIRKDRIPVNPELYLKKLK